LFIAEENDVKQLIGKTIYFAEPLLEDSNITLITDDQEFIEKAKQYNLVPSGCNPFDYIIKDSDEE
jgi:hypothetical protein